MSEEEIYCEKHHVYIIPTSKGYDFCPYCREERRIEEQRIERMTKDPMVEPY